jgi:membrane-associated phospholipid phosphatase
MCSRSLLLVAALGLVVSPARADDQIDDRGADRIPGHHVDAEVDGLIAGAALLGTVAVSMIPIREDAPLWDRQVVAADLAATRNFSRRASHVSDALLVASLAAPAIYLTGGQIDDADGDRLVLYGQTLAINGLFAQAAKHLVQRPRPYLYGNSEEARAYGREHRADSRKSFYSGHAALSFGAAVSGAYLLGASDESATARRIAWGAGIAIATTTASLRVRAGKHFYSDVVTGALIGAAVGYLVPALHAEDAPYVPDGAELAAAGLGIAAGLVLARLLPVERAEPDADDGAGSDAEVRTRRAQAHALGRSYRLAPTTTERGVGLSLVGVF